MHVITPRSSTLNPNAPSFIPMAYRAVEDFSDQWWALIQSCPWFRDYWLRERFQDPQIDAVFSDLDDDLDFLPADDYKDVFAGHQEGGKQRDGWTDLLTIGDFKWGNGRIVAESPRYAEKAPKLVKFKVSPRTIHQPR